MAAKHIRIVGIVILLAGLVAAVAIYCTAPAEESGGILGIDIPTKRDRNQLERMGGKSYVLFKELDDWFGSLWHGRRLGCTIGVLSAFGFLLCRGLARVEEDYSAGEGHDSRQPLKTPDPATPPPTTATPPPAQEPRQP